MKQDQSSTPPMPSMPLSAVAQTLLNAVEHAAEMYDELALGPLGAAAKYGPDYTPPSDDDWLALRQELQDAATLARTTPTSKPATLDRNAVIEECRKKLVFLAEFIGVGMKQDLLLDAADELSALKRAAPQGPEKGSPMRSRDMPPAVAARSSNKNEQSPTPRTKAERIALWLEDAANDGFTSASPGDQHSFRVAATLIRSLSGELAAALVEQERLRAGWVESDRIALAGRIADAASSATAPQACICPQCGTRMAWDMARVNGGGAKG